MKKVKISRSAVTRAAAALDEVEVAVHGRKIARVRTDVRAGAEDGGGFKCKPWLCPVPMYGVPLPADL